MAFVASFLVCGPGEALKVEVDGIGSSIRTSWEARWLFLISLTSALFESERVSFPDKNNIERWP